jgi:beta-glucosidase
MIKKEQFGSDFLWGVSTAAYQIEGAYQIDGKGLSIWDYFSNYKNSKYIKDRSNANTACNHYHVFREDLELIKYLNIPNYRFSIAWPRIFPDGVGHINQKGVDFYDRLIDSMLELGITPWATLYHWDLPMALQQKGGWKNRDILFWFEEYVSFCSKRYGDRVKDWMILNEPMVFTGAGHFLGFHAPGLKGLGNFIPSMLHAALCNGLGGRLVRENVKDARIGTTISCSHIDPINQNEKNILAAGKMDALLNRLYIEPILGMGFPLTELPSLKSVEKIMSAGDEYLMAFDFDFIGVQNYTREVVESKWYVPYVGAKLIGAKERKVPYTTMGWEIYPESIYKVLKKFHAYGKIKQFIVTENGAAFEDKWIDQQIDDKMRTEYIQSYLSKVLEAKNEGVPVNGYFVWTLMDNFEWAEGFTQRFGLVGVDSKNQKRIVKSSGEWYRRFLG